MKDVRDDSHQSKEDDTWSQGILFGHISIKKISFEGFPLLVHSNILRSVLLRLITDCS